MSLDLDKARKAAGERYAAAAGELIEALVDLAALEHATPPAPFEKTFEAFLPEDVLRHLRHRTFYPHAPKALRPLVDARLADIRNQAAA